MTEQKVFGVGGYMGQILMVDLETQTSRAEALSEADASRLIGGYGLGAKFLYEHQPRGVDSLGAENWLGFTTGPLTGSGVPTGTRWTVVTKSPLTGTWGDANGSGWFGQKLKAAGYDAVYFRGVSADPVYALIDEGEVKLEPAADLWGLDTFEVDDRLLDRYGKDAQVACIGEAGENLSLISGIVHAKARIAARSGVGAVMGSKRLKAVVVRGRRDIPVRGGTREAKKKYVGQIKNDVAYSEFYRTTGTPGATVGCVRTADAPIRNWAGAPDDYSQVEKIGAQALYAPGRKKRTCWACPIACWSDVYIEQDPVPQPEYETIGAFGPLQLVDDLKAILKSNELCNRYGLDTISTGTTIAFAMECYERALISEKDVGFRLTWGDGEAAIRLVEAIGRREGFGSLLADGVKRAAEQIGQGSEAFAIHLMGQELPMHDPRLEPGLGVVYLADATPGRHNQANCFLPPEGLEIDFPGFGKGVEDQRGRGRVYKKFSALFHVLQTAGACQFGYLSTTVDFLVDSLSAVTGHSYSIEEVLECGERIANVRQAFNIREGINFLKAEIPERAYGMPPLERGPVAGVTVQLKMMLDEYLEEMKWNRETAVPSADRLRELELDFVVEDMRRAAALSHV